MEMELQDLQSQFEALTKSKQEVCLLMLCTLIHGGPPKKQATVIIFKLRTWSASSMLVTTLLFVHTKTAEQTNMTQPT